MPSPKISTLVFAAFLAFLSPLAADEYTGTANFSHENVKITQANGYDYIQLTDGVPCAAAGSPALPVLQLDVAIPYDATVSDLAVLSTEIMEMEGTFQVVPMTEPKRISSEDTPMDPFYRDPLFYEANSDFPGFYVEYLSTWELVGQKFAKLAFHPLQYNPLSGKLTFAKQIQFRLFWNKSVQIPEVLSFNLTKAGEKYYKKALLQRTLNPEAVAIPPYTNTHNSILPQKQYEHVIITPQAFESQWDRLIEWHMRKGLPDVVVTKEFIYAHYSGQSPQERIRSFIKDAHSAWGTRYFLIGADGGFIPKEPELYLLGKG